MDRVRTSVIAAGGIGLAVALGLSACGSVQQLSAKDSVSKAMSSYEKAKSAKFVLSLDTTAADLDALNQADGDHALSRADLAALEKVLAGDVTISVQAPDGKTFGDSRSLRGLSFDPSALAKDPQAYATSLRHSGAVELAVDYRGSALADLRVVHGVVYAKADGPAILTLAGQPQAQLDQALQGLPASLAPITKAAHNQWVSIDVASALPSLLKSGPVSDLPTATASINPATIQNLLDALRSAYRKNVTITKVGSGAKGTDYRLSAPIRQIATAVEPQLQALTGQFGDAAGGSSAVPSATELRQQIATLPNKSFDADVWVKDDTLTGFSLDLAQFDDRAPAGHPVRLNVDITMNGGQVSAPSGATPIDVQALVKDVQSEVGDVSSGSGFSDAGSASGGQLDVKALKQAGFSDAEIKRLQKEIAAGR